MLKWSRSKRVQAVVAFALALLSTALVFVQMAMESFNNFYFPPHKAYPYPHATEWAARLAIGRNCGLTFIGVFAILYVAQRLFVAARQT